MSLLNKLCTDAPCFRFFVVFVFIVLVSHGIADENPSSNRRNWGEKEVVLEFVSQLRQRLGIQSLEDWYKLTLQDVTALKARALLNKTKGGIFGLVEFLSDEGFIERPLEGWDPKRFGKATSWDRIEKIESLVAKLKLLKQITQTEDWYGVGYQDFVAAGGNGFLRRVGGSPQKGILILSQKGLIDTPAGGWRAESFGAGVDWDRNEERRTLVQTLVKEAKIIDPEDWYSISVKQIEQAGGAGLLSRHQGSPAKTILDLSESGHITPPIDGWMQKKFAPETKWDRPKLRQALVKTMESALSITQPEDWYQVRGKHFTDNGGGGLLKRFKSIEDLVTELSRQGFIKAPANGWDKSRFSKINKWDKLDTMASLVNRMKKKFNLVVPADWYGVTQAHFNETGGSGFLAKFRGSPMEAVKVLSTAGLIEEPQGGWLTHMFGNRTNWDLAESRSLLVSNLIEALQLSDSMDWYKVKAKDFIDYGGSGFLQKSGSVAKAILSLSKEGLISPPDRGWEIHLFNQSRKWQSREHKRALVNRLRENLKIKEPHDWYRITTKDILIAKGGGLLNRFKGSPASMIMALSKEGLIDEPILKWERSLFGHPAESGEVKPSKTSRKKKKSKGWNKSLFGTTDWSDKSRLLIFVEKIVALKKISKPEDWYLVRRKDFVEANGEGLYRRFNGDIPEILKSLSENGLVKPPAGGWERNLFRPQLVRGKWAFPERRKRLVAQLKKAAGIRRPEDWYKINTSHFSQIDSVDFLSTVGDSPKKAILVLSKEGLIKSPKDGWVEDSFFSRQDWNDPTVLKNLVSKLESHLNIKKPEQWYQVTVDDFRAVGGIGYLNKKRSLTTAIIELAGLGYFESPPSGWDMEQFGNSRWATRTAQKELVQHLAKLLGVKKAEDWYQISQKSFEEVGANSFYKQKGGPAKAIIALSMAGLINPPKGGWREEEFGQNTNWDLQASRERLVKEMKERFKIEAPEDWYRISTEDFRAASALGFLRRHGISVAKSVIALSKEGLISPPKNGWDIKAFYKELKGQKTLAKFLENIIGEQSIFNDRRSHGVRNPKTNRPLEADISFPSLKIAVEYQGPHHREDLATMERDEVKRKLFPERGWLLLEVWESNWTRSEEFVKDMLLEALPDHPTQSEAQIVLLRRLSGHDCNKMLKKLAH